MKKILIFLSALFMIFVGLGAGLIYLAETYPFQPGDLLYGTQLSAEQWRLRLTTGALDQADFSLQLAERRLVDLAQAVEPGHVQMAASAFDHALSGAMRRIELIPQNRQEGLSDRLNALVVQAHIVIGALDSGVYGLVLEALHQKVDDLRLTATEQEPPRSIVLDDQIEAEPVPFLGQDIEHLDFPLVGGHANLECTDCHAQGAYADTPTNCSNCHEYAADPRSLDDLYALRAVSGKENNPLAYPGWLSSEQLYPQHFPGECSECHITKSWEPDEFDHAGVIECGSCHLEDIPDSSVVDDILQPAGRLDVLAAEYIEPVSDQLVNISTTGQLTTETISPESIINLPPDHFSGECDLCHSDVSSWEVISFEHEGVQECGSCHELDVPQDHYAGECINCHSDAQDWGVFEMDHSGLTNCQSCHRIADHYSGQCSSCHSTLSWISTSFDHSSYTDCRSCHTRPVKHDPGQCTRCHNTADWSQASYDHRDSRDCKDCHNSPAGHYDSGCSTCHSTSSWRPTFTHTGIVDCVSCHEPQAPSAHYPGQCSTCHNTAVWASASFSHASFPDCSSCHAASAPDGHWLGECSNCHNTDVWSNAIFNHGGYTDCVSCHTPPSGHWTDQCSNCHDTSSWKSVSFDHSTAILDCKSCHQPPEADHYLDQCASCHNTTSWTSIRFDHTGFDNCSSCHLAPDGHWPGQCSYCHNTDDWADVHFDHTSYTDCKSCHNRPANHSPGQCSRCHNTESWEIPDTPTPTAIITDTLEITVTPTLTITLTPTPTPTITTTITTTIGLPVVQLPTLVFELPAPPPRLQYSTPVPPPTQPAGKSTLPRPIRLPLDRPPR
jgi:hypothetical protein